MMSITEAREAFAATAADFIAEAAGADVASRKTTGWTKRCVWYSEADYLTAVVGAQEEKYADIALAHGLALAAGRPLRLVLPRGWEHPSLQRRAWLTSAIDIYTHDYPAQPQSGSVGTTAVSPCPTRNKGEAMRLAGGPERSPEKHLGPSGEFVRELLEWAATHPQLSSGHRRDLRAWAHRGQRVLTATSTKTSVTIKAGIDASSSPALSRTFTRPLKNQDLQTIVEAVEAGIKDAQAETHGPFEEHHLQEMLRRRPHVLGLEQPVLREVPAWRPSGGSKSNGRGFIDLLGRDGVGDIAIVETKLAADDMLVLQGLDYWIWANRKTNRNWLDERLHAPKQAGLRLVYAVGGKGGTTPVLSKYAKAHLAALDETVDWQLALLHDWKTDLKVELLPRRSTRARAASGAG